jgi:hypothetical protein
MYTYQPFFFTTEEQKKIQNLVGMHSFNKSTGTGYIQGLGGYLKVFKHLQFRLFENVQKQRN